MECVFYTTAQLKDCILLRCQELEEKLKTAHPDSFFSKTYPIRKARYLELLGKLEKGERLSNFVVSRLLHKGARHVVD
jgi:hypothetical protein